MPWLMVSPQPYFRPSDLLPLPSSLHPLQGLLSLTCRPLQPRGTTGRACPPRGARCSALLQAPWDGGFGRGDEQLRFFLQEHMISPLPSNPEENVAPALPLTDHHPVT